MVEKHFDNKVLLRFWIGVSSLTLASLFCSLCNLFKGYVIIRVINTVILFLGLLDVDYISFYANNVLTIYDDMVCITSLQPCVISTLILF